MDGMDVDLDLVMVEGRVAARVGTTDENAVEVQLAIGEGDFPSRVSLTLSQEQFNAILMAADLHRTEPDKPAEASNPGYPVDDHPALGRRRRRLGVVKGDGDG